MSTNDEREELIRSNLLRWGIDDPLLKQLHKDIDRISQWAMRAGEKNSLQQELDEFLEAGGTHADMRNEIAAGYLDMAIDCANHELRLLDLKEFSIPNEYCRSALSGVAARKERIVDDA